MLQNFGRKLVPEYDVFRRVNAVEGAGPTPGLKHVLKMVQRVQIRPAYAARQGLDQGLARTRNRVGDLVTDELAIPSHHSAHGPVSPRSWILSLEASISLKARLGKSATAAGPSV